MPTDYRSRYGMDFLPMLWNGNFDSASIEAVLRANTELGAHYLSLPFR